nr:ATP-binding protein [uncultured Holophaga sp.]
MTLEDRIEGQGDAESRYQALEQLFSLFLEHSPVYVYFKDEELRPVLLSRNFEKLFRRPLSQILGRRMEELFLPELAASMAEDDRRVTREGILLRVEEEFDGRHFTSIKFPVKRPGHPTYLAGITLETTEQEQAKRALAASEARHRQLFESLALGMAVNEVIRDEDGRAVDYRIIEVNPGFTVHTGLEAEDCVGRLGSELFGEQALQTLETLAMVAAGGGYRSFEGFHQGLGRHLTVRIFCLEPGSFVSFFEDVTERRRQEQERRRLEEEFQHMQQLESLGSLAGGVAHDMNNVLQAIQGMASALKAKCGDHDELVSGLDLILSASQRGGDLVRSLTEFARKGLPEPVPVGLNEIVGREVELLRRTTLQRIEVQVDLEESLPEVLGDPSAIANALMNLSVNAMDAMPQRGTLRFCTRRTMEGGADIVVEDTGEGMSPEVLARAMEPFFTTKPRGKGTGLGLASVYGTIKAHLGSMHLASEPGLGTRVTLRFPPIRKESCPGSQVGRPAGPCKCARGLRIHLIDDDELIRESFPEFVGLLGHQVVATDSDGEAGLRRLREEAEPDVVVMDHNMPGISGIEALARLRQFRQTLPVLLCTGYLDEEARKALGRWPRVQVLLKPFSLDSIQDALAAVL